MLLDLIAGAVVLVFAGIGALRGTLATAARISVLLFSYLMAWLASTRLAGSVADLIGMNSFVGGAIAGLTAFVASLVLAGIVVRMLLRRDRRRHLEQPRSAPDRVGGGLIGATYGVLLSVLIAWLALWLDAAHQVGTLDVGLQTDGSSVAQKATSSLLRAGGGLALGDGPGAQVAINLLASPSETIESFEQITEAPSVIGLQEDRLFWQYVGTGAVDQALNRGSFLRVANDEELRSVLAEIGVVSEQARDDPREFRRAIREVLGQVGPALRDLQDDPELHALFSDEQIQRAAQEGDTIALMSHPGFRRLVRRVVNRIETH